MRAKLEKTREVKWNKGKKLKEWKKNKEKTERNAYGR